jgi:hypothetical protein
MKNRLAVLGLIFAVGLLPRVHSQQSDELLQQLLRGIEENEQKIANLRVDGTCVVEKWDPNSHKWNYNGEHVITGWFIGGAGGKARIDYHKEVSRWTDGPAPFSEDSYTVAYNGQDNRTLFTQRGFPPHPTLLGQLDMERALALRNECATGWEYSLLGFLEYERQSGERPSAVLARAKPGLLTARMTIFKGTACIALQVLFQGKPVRSWYFDPARGFSLLGAEDTDMRGRVIQSWSVEKLLEPAAGIFYPGKAEQIISNKSGEPMERAAYEATSVVVNDPKFSEDVFTIAWPTGTRVKDNIAHKEFIAGDEPAKPEVQKQEPEPHVTSVAATPALPASGHQRSFSRITVTVLILGTVALLALVTVLVRTKR